MILNWAPSEAAEKMLDSMPARSNDVTFEFSHMMNLYIHLLWSMVKVESNIKIELIGESVSFFFHQLWQ